MINLKNFEYLVGDKKSLGVKSTIPYENNICNFLGDLSDELNRIKVIKKYPDIKTLAFWCRKKNILNLSEICLGGVSETMCFCFVYVTSGVIHGTQ